MFHPKVSRLRGLPRSIQALAALLLAALQQTAQPLGLVDGLARWSVLEWQKRTQSWKKNHKSSKCGNFEMLELCEEMLLFCGHLHLLFHDFSNIYYIHWRQEEIDCRQSVSSGCTRLLSCANEKCVSATVLAFVWSIAWRSSQNQR